MTIWIFDSDKATNDSNTYKYRFEKALPQTVGLTLQKVLVTTPDYYKKLYIILYYIII